MTVVVADYFSKIFVQQTTSENESSIFLMARRQIFLLFRIMKVMCPSEDKVQAGLLEVPYMRLGCLNLGVHQL